MYCIAILVIIIIAICLCCVTKSNFKPKSIYTGNIPKVIIQTGADMESLKKGSDKWRTIHPDFEYVYFDNNGCKDFIRKYLVKFQKNYKSAILITSHNLAEIKYMCDYLIILEDGKVKDFDTIRNLLKKGKKSKIEELLLND